MSKLIAKALPDVNASRIYPTGPQRLQPSDIPGFQPREGAEGEEAAPETFGWFYHDEEAGPYRGFGSGMRAIADAIEEAGGVDGVLAFSQFSFGRKCFPVLVGVSTPNSTSLSLMGEKVIL